MVQGKAVPTPFVCLRRDVVTGAMGQVILLECALVIEADTRGYIGEVTEVKDPAVSREVGHG